MHFITFSCYQRRPLFTSPHACSVFLRALEEIRRQYRLVVVAYVVMPEHVHLLISEPERADLSAAIKALKQSVSRQLLHQSDCPQFWQHRFYDFNVFTDRKRIEKLRYIHRNPVTRALAARPEEWQWSSFRYYANGEIGPVTVNAVPPRSSFRAAAGR